MCFKETKVKWMTLQKMESKYISTLYLTVSLDCMFSVPPQC